MSKRFKGRYVLVTESNIYPHKCSYRSYTDKRDAYAGLDRAKGKRDANYRYYIVDTVAQPWVSLG